MPAAERPATLSIRHLGSDERYEQPLAWRDDGSAESTWDIPRGAKLGRYDVVLVRPAPDGRPEWEAWERTAGQVRVEEFRVPLMRGVVQLPAGPADREQEGERRPRRAATSPAGRPPALPVVLRGEVRPRGFPAPDGLDAFTFANGAVRPGVFHDADGDAGRRRRARAAAADAHARRRGYGARPAGAAAR